ncbi:biopolymer transporter ExbD [Calditrichota bacterium]
MGRFKPSERRKGEQGDPELNLTPIMNLMVCLIPLLLSVAQLTELALLEYMPPAESAPDEGGGGSDDENNTPDEDQPKNLSLLVNFTDSSKLQVSMYGKVKEGEHFYEILPVQPGQYNLAALEDSLWSIKQREVGESTGLDSIQDLRTGAWETFPKFRVKDGREVSITAKGEVPFQTVVNVMDLCRYREVDGRKEELFPITLLKQFQ